MTYEKFKTILLKELKLHFPSDTSITLQAIPRNNSVAQEGLTILESGLNIAPTLYLQEYYEDFKNGASIVNILEKLLESYYEYRPAENIDPSFFRDFSNIQDRIVYRLIHRKQNEELLEEIPHLPYLDLAIVFYCLLRSGEAGNATILIRNSHLELWQTDVESLLSLAQSNTPFLLSPKCDEISELLTSLMAEEPESGIPDEETHQNFPSMYVLTNESRMYGATCILYKDLLSDLAERFSQDFYILPSSVHEVILVPDDQDFSKEYLNTMIQEVNASQLMQEEVLSDHLYYYCREKGRIFG